MTGFDSEYRAFSDSRKKVMTAAVAMIVLFAGSAVLMNGEIEHEDSEAVPWAILIPVVEFAVGFFSGYILNDVLSPDQTTEAASRASEASILASSLSSGVGYYVNSLSQYANMWPLTQEHWIRQAELACASLWSEDKSYDTIEILEGSSLYANIGTLMSNVSAQVNAHWEDIGKRTSEWNDYVEVYGDGKMKLALKFDSGATFSAAAGEQWQVRIGGVIDTDSDHNRAWVEDGMLYASKSGTITMTDEDGVHEYRVTGGQWNDLSDSFVPGVYTFPSDGVFCGNITEVFGAGSKAADVLAGAVAMINGGTHVFTCCNYDESPNGSTSDGQTQYKPTCDVTLDGSKVYDNVRISIIVDEAESSQDVDITDILARYQMLLNTTYNTLLEVNSRAAAVWDIYDEAGAASAFVTTLLVPELYEDMNLSPEMVKAITTMAMQEAYDYWDQYGEAIKQDEYQITQESGSLLCRGSIKISNYTITDVNGIDHQTAVEYNDVIFTPFFNDDREIHVGSNSVSRDELCMVMIWTTDGQPLNTFDKANADSMDILFLTKDTVMEITSIYYDGEPVNSKDLNAAGIEDVEPDKPDIPNLPKPTYDNPNDTGELLRPIFLAGGFVSIAFGAYQRNPIWMIVGLILVLVGVFATEWLEDKFELWWGWEFHWPGSDGA